MKRKIRNSTKNIKSTDQKKKQNQPIEQEKQNQPTNQKGQIYNNATKHNNNNGRILKYHIYHKCAHDKQQRTQT